MKNIHRIRRVLDSKTKKKDPKFSVPKLAIEAQRHFGKEANPEILWKNNINWRVAWRKPFVNPKNCTKRLQLNRKDAVKIKIFHFGKLY